LHQIKWRRRSYVIQVKAESGCRLLYCYDYSITQAFMTDDTWQPINTAPFDCDLELAVVEGKETHALVFRCRRASAGWINATTGERINVDPTHWRKWDARHSD
jgi:hypothetical protein